MVRSSQVMISVAALSLALATALGAYASHGLEAVLDAATLGSLLTAIQYQFYHSLGLLGLGLLQARWPSRLLIAAAVLLGAGLVLFSAGLSAAALGAPEWTSRGAPLGGSCYIVGWIVVAFAAWRARGEVLG